MSFTSMEHDHLPREQLEELALLDNLAGEPPIRMLAVLRCTKCNAQYERFRSPLSPEVLIDQIKAKDKIGNRNDDPFDLKDG